jgi:hypothetical protein
MVRCACPPYEIGQILAVVQVIEIIKKRRPRRPNLAPVGINSSRVPSIAEPTSVPCADLDTNWAV